MIKTLIPILGDQLSTDISSLRGVKPADTHILMAEVWDEATYVRHHKKKIALVFSAMRHFAAELERLGFSVRYVRLDDDSNSGSLKGEVIRTLRQTAFDRIRITEPGEWRLREDLESWSADLNIPVDILDDDRYLASHEDFRDWAQGRKQLRMEYFYRAMRRKTGLLMDAEGQPEGGRWNFDTENRKPAKADLLMPKPLRFDPDDTTRDVLALVASQFDAHFGDLEPFWFPVTREQAEAALDGFIDNALPWFGDFQDAMVAGEKFLYHSLLSTSLNIGLLSPLEVCQRVEMAYDEGKAPLNAVEGFIRQIIGWREYVRGIYWHEGPTYKNNNFFNAERPLPDFYWTAKTDMACMQAAIVQTKEEAYAHHIQRLMVTGTFALLAGVHPHDVHEWYLAVYADAFEWVELPNTLGMSQFADGGLLASKPYAASGAYINKMSDYCNECRYQVKIKHGQDACPFNYLYWDFMARHEAKLRGNPRLAMVYRSWDKMAMDTKQAHRESASAFLKDLA